MYRLLWSTTSNSPFFLSAVGTAGAVFCSLVLVAGTVLSQSQPSGRATPPSQKPVADELDNLDEQLLEGIGGAASSAGTAAPLESERRNESSGSEGGKITRSGTSGSDVGRENPLAGIRQQMLRVEQLLDQRNVSAETQQTQQHIVEQLDQLIAALASSQQSRQQKKQRLDSASTPQGDQQAVKNGREPASDASGKPEVTESAPRPPAAVQTALKEIWGHLPERLRRQVRSAESAEFLPKYRRLIEDYFSRLAEDR